MSSLASPTASQSAEPSIPFAPRLRCQHVSRNGRACRYLAVSAKQPFCKHHLPKGTPEHLSELMYRVCHNFMTPDHVTNVLHSIFFALADGEISERRAGVLTYILQTILNSQRANLQLQRLIATSERQGFAVDNPFASDDSESKPISQPSPDKPTWNLPPTAAPEPPLASAASESSPGTPISRSAADDISSDGAPAPCSDRSSDRPASDRPLQPPQTDTGAALGGRSFSSDIQPQASSPSDAARCNRQSDSSVPPAPPPDLNHFFPRDPSLPRSMQDPSTCSPPPSLYRSSSRRYASVRHTHPHDDPDWKIINGR